MEPKDDKGWRLRPANGKVRDFPLTRHASAPR